MWGVGTGSGRGHRLGVLSRVVLASPYGPGALAVGLGTTWACVSMGCVGTVWAWGTAFLGHDGGHGDVEIGRAHV